ncbi:6874_t:CDS:2, partial [Gigaspora rosea]
YKDRRVPMITVVKCGSPEEEGQKKAGNRGKRDSQLILMNFFSRVTYNDRMTPLDYDLFRKTQYLMGVTPDFFETVLMVDADTKVYPDSLRLLINCLCNDRLIMGLCGETKIANKRDSWVTAIQVFEYYISHHLGKGFESVFGGVTCLPGCFCMYRLKARKGDDDWVPIITKPEIVQEYSQNVVDTLHQKNLLLLGEDRFLTTLMLRNFPYRKMTFCPQAICKTVVPDSFRVLLSQRRRWINSTIHNLMELVLVRNLCGTFCFSMQFVVFMELMGTVVLPIAIILTFLLIITSIINPPADFAEAIPLMMLAAVLGLPAILILITTRKLVYIAWMMIYLLALPIWNFILPTYAYWHFDDFSWGETRKVEGEEKGDSHGGKDGQFDPSKVPFKRWEDWERNRLRKLRRQERQRQGAPYSNEQNESNPSLLDPYDSSSVVSRGSTNDIGQQHHFYDYNHTNRIESRPRQRPEFYKRHSQVENLRLINDGSSTSIDSYDTNNGD